MPSNNSKYTEEFREQIATRSLETGQSATSMAEEMGIDLILSADGSEITVENIICLLMLKKKDYEQDHQRIRLN